ncbi:MAG: FdtA/QdtA family cupin domain-containing protein [Alphaproteobacteria bacterium]|nr:FdtA/QdtA family cupin domain-containing protein [Alphaproteobacteria bacterium]
MHNEIMALKKITDPRGSLVVLEQGQGLPFAVKRCYFIYDTKSDAPRGFHAHKTLEQILLCVAGGCDLTLDDGKSKTTIRLDDPATAVHVGPMTWREMSNFTPGCVLLALASDVYDESDYIRDYGEFKKQVLS